MKWLEQIVGCFSLLVLTAFALGILSLIWKKLAACNTSTIILIGIPAVCLISYLAIVGVAKTVK